MAQRKTSGGITSQYSEPKFVNNSESQNGVQRQESITDLLRRKDREFKSSRTGLSLQQQQQALALEKAKKLHPVSASGARRPATTPIKTPESRGSSSVRHGSRSSPAAERKGNVHGRPSGEGASLSDFAKVGRMESFSVTTTQGENESIVPSSQVEILGIII